MGSSEVNGVWMGDVRIPGSLRRPFAWAIAFFYPLTVLPLAYIFWINRIHGYWSGMTMVVFVIFAYGVGTYVALLTTIINAFSLTLKDEGVAVRYRKPLTPWIASSHEGRIVTWNELREPSVMAGEVQVKSNDPYNWLHLSYEQARALLTDPRCPLAGKLPEKVREKLGLPKT